MKELNEPVPDSEIVNTVEDAVAFCRRNWLSGHRSTSFYT